MTTTPTILVVGATGTTGGRTVARLASAGHHVRAASRRARPVAGAEPVAFDWYDPATHAAALDGADRVYLVPPVGDSDPRRPWFRSCDWPAPWACAARCCSVLRPFPRAGRMVGTVHQALPGLIDQWAVLRPSWFMQNFTGDHAHGRSIRDDGVIRTATGNGRVGFVDAEDIAAVAARALTDERAPDTDLVLTGPETLSHDDIAAAVTEFTGRPVAHHRLSYEQMRDRHTTELPVEFAALLVGLDRGIAGGAEDRVTDTVQRVTGRPPHTFRSVLEREMRRDR